MTETSLVYTSPASPTTTRSGYSQTCRLHDSQEKDSDCWKGALHLKFACFQETRMRIHFPLRKTLDWSYSSHIQEKAAILFKVNHSLPPASQSSQGRFCSCSYCNIKYRFYFSVFVTMDLYSYVSVPFHVHFVLSAGRWAESSRVKSRCPQICISWH